MPERRLAVALGLLLTLGLAALHLHAHRHAGPLWRDEVNSVNLATRPLAEVLANGHLDSFPPAWPVLLHAWIRTAGDTDETLRRLGLVVGLATLAVCWWAGHRLGLAAPLVTLLLFGMSPSEIIYGGSVRGYGLGALAMLAAMATVWTFVTRPGWRSLLVAQVAALAAVQTYFPNAVLLFAVGAGGAAVCLRQRAWRRLVAVGLLGLVAAATLLLNLPWVEYAFRVAELEQGDWPFVYQAGVFRAALAPGVPALAVAWAIAAACAALGCALAFRSGASPRNECDIDRALFVAVTAVVALVSYFAYLTFVARLPTQFWYYLSPMALLAMVCDVGTDLLARRVPGGARIRLASVACLALLAAPDAAATVRVRMTNLDQAARTIEATARADDLVVVFPWVTGITFARYYRGPAPWMTLPDFPEHRFHLHLLVGEKMRAGDAGIASELARVERALRGGGRVWIVGPLRAPPEGERPAPLPPAPTGPRGWTAAPYLDAWELALGALLRTHAVSLDQLQLPDVGPVNAWENLPVLVAQGWR